MKDKIKLLMEIMLDPNASLTEKDDAAIELGNFVQLNVLEFLVKIASDEDQDYLIKSSAGESIALIMIGLDLFNEKYLLPLTRDAKNEAIHLLRAKKPEWKNRIEKIDDLKFYLNN